MKQLIERIKHFCKENLLEIDLIMKSILLIVLIILSFIKRL